MTEELLKLQQQVNGVIYNPFVNLKDYSKAILVLLKVQEKDDVLIERLKNEILELDKFDDYRYDNMERAKGFNKTKNRILKIISEALCLK